MYSTPIDRLSSKPSMGGKRRHWGLFGELFGEHFGSFGHVSGDLPGSPSGTLREASGVSLGASWERSGGGPCYAIIKVFFCTGGGCNMLTYEVQVKKVVKIN